MKITRAVVPSLFTVLNMFCGLMSIIYSGQQDYILGAWFIILAAIFDSLDGMMARITKSASAFGIEFDSLSDIISFGAAPAFLVFAVHLHTLEGLGVLLSSLLLVFGGIRLARFNVQLLGFDKEYFTGLPIPSSAITVASFVLMFYDNTLGLNGLTRKLLAPMVITLSLLMVSRVKYDALPEFTKRGIKKHPWRFMTFTAGMVAIVVTRGTAIFPFFVLFVLSGPLRVFSTTVWNVIHHVPKVEEEESEATTIDI
ncbi:MAG: CDP-diacylglycerol--serine O-phosphatidyltransferase [Bacteroidota bacterium]